MKTTKKNKVNEPISVATYGMSDKLRNSGILDAVNDLSHEDKSCLIRYIHETDEAGSSEFVDLDDNHVPYTIEELNARIDEAEAEMDRGEGKTFEDMMNGFREELLWLK